jgi:hypothetical protein
MTQRHNLFWTRVVRHVFVVDNDSHDESLTYLETSISDERVRIIRNGNNLGFAAACNLGACASAADTLLFLNPDSVLAPGALRRMIEVLESNPSIGMVGGLLCNPDGSEQPGGRRVFPTPRRAFMRTFGLSHLGKWFPSLFSDFLLHMEPLPLAPTPPWRPFLVHACLSSAKLWRTLDCGTWAISCIARTWTGACVFG